MDRRVTLKIELTPQQQEQLRPVTAKEAPAMSLTLERLEDRTAPIWMDLGYPHAMYQRAC